MSQQTEQNATPATTESTETTPLWVYVLVLLAGATGAFFTWNYLKEEENQEKAKAVGKQLLQDTSTSAFLGAATASTALRVKLGLSFPFILIVREEE